MRKKNIFKNIINLSIFIFVITMLSACSNVETDSESDWSSYELMEEAAFESVIEGIAVEWDEDEESTVSSIPILLPSESGRQLVYTVDFDIETTEFRSNMRLLLDTVVEMEGYSERVIENGRSLHYPNVERFAFFVFRVPNERLSDFLMFIEANYNIVRLDKQLLDFTTTYDRNTADLEDLFDQEQRILGDLNDEESDVDESDLSNVRSQIRRLEEANTVIQRDVDYSTVTIRLSEVIIEPEVVISFSERLQNTFEILANGLLATLQSVILIAVVAVPWGLIIALFVGLVIYIMKKYKKKRGEKG